MDTKKTPIRSGERWGGERGAGHLNSNVTVIESQVDWLTASCHTRRGTELLRAHVDIWLADEVRRGERKHAFRLMGYQGQQAGRVRWGERDNAGLVQLSGDLAEQHLSTVRTLQDTITRVDICTTVQTAELNDDVGDDHYGQALVWYDANPNAARPERKSDGDGGCTISIGRRESPYVLRVYNKQREREADHDVEGAARYQRCWRYELETKGYAAPGIARLADDHEDRADWIQSFLYLYCAEHGILPLFPPTGAQALKPGFTRRSDRQRTLEWFAKTVAPAIQRCLSTGDPSDVSKALGISV